ncbi:hypothetical protein AAHA92_06679 [Salvia divinorum]|uniref:Uncharacterized protein n=1 Tax=Salvia divinorum TaxID=28513 RepID=A0ABD1I9Z8_SALDI
MPRCIYLSGVKERKRSKRNSIQETWRRKNKSKNYKSFIDQSLHAHKRKEIREGLRDGLPLHVNTPNTTQFRSTILKFAKVFARERAVIGVEISKSCGNLSERG